MKTFRLAHLSDPHLTPPSLGASPHRLSAKRLLSQASWRRKRSAAHRPEVLDAIVADIAAQEPDHIVVTGDLTNFAAPEEFAAARLWLEGLAAPRDLTVSPGNHDALVGAGGPERFAPWTPWLGDESAPSFPQARVRGPVAIVNLCSAVPTAPLLAQGVLGDAQIAAAEELLAELGRRDLYRVVLVHHPVVSGVVSRRKSLTDQAALREVLKSAGAELVLHGHAHAAVVATTPGPKGPIPVLGVPSASAVPGGHGEAARWHMVEVDAAPGGGFSTRIVARGFNGPDRVEELGRYVLPPQG